jgi:hypothetical protein
VIPERPLLSVPFLLRRIALFTVLDAFLPYLAIGSASCLCGLMLHFQQAHRMPLESTIFRQGGDPFPVLKQKAQMLIMESPPAATR